MPVNKKIKPRPRQLNLSGMSPRKAIKHLENMITHTPEPYRAGLRIENSYDWETGAWRLHLICYTEEKK